ncbi:protein SPO16 homolog isoform X2 [Oryctolagus cuniculus]|uniref:protein SPO16 homolog isoform X2 n=1 Tax=Oryctolagus cuniculus TaxID=9986 RepID=UPI003879A95F
MAESGGKEKIKWTTTVIISSSLKGREIATALENRSHKIRYSDSVENGSIIFSLSVLSAALHGPEEWKLIFRIQQRFLGSNLRILPVHNTVNAINLMSTIAKTASKPCISNICYRMITAKAHIIEQSPVWKTLQKIKLNDDPIFPN